MMITLLFLVLSLKGEAKCSVLTPLAGRLVEIARGSKELSMREDKRRYVICLKQRYGQTCSKGV